MKRIITFLIVASLLASCDNLQPEQKSDSGVEKAHITVKTDAQGHTTEQKNILRRIEMDNTIGSIKHLYIVSTYTGDVLEYSTVDGKVTSGGKRISPRTVDAASGVNTTGVSGNYVTIDGTKYLTDEVLDEGGTYGDSGNYLYWFDAQGNYHQYYPSGGTYLHISDKPLRVKKANFSITLE